MTNKDFAIKLASKLEDSGIKDACMNFMHEHPEMFVDTYSGDGKIMSISMSVTVVSAEDKIKTDPGFINVILDKDNVYSKHYKHNNVYWNDKRINVDEHYKLGRKKWLVDHPMGTDLENELSCNEIENWFCELPDEFTAIINGVVVNEHVNAEWLDNYIQSIDCKNGCVPYEEDGVIHLWVGGIGMEGKDIVIQK